MKFPESPFAHKYLDGLKGVEIGASAHNSFGIKDCINVDYTDDMTTIFKQEEIKLCGEAAQVDVVADGDNLPFNDNTWEYVLSSHVFEHFPNPILALQEWARVLKDGGLIFCVIPHRDAAEADKDRNVTPIAHFIQDYLTNQTVEAHAIPKGHGKRGHYHVYTYESFKALIGCVNKLEDWKDSVPGTLSRNPRFQLEWIDGMPISDKCPNGHTHVVKVRKS